MASEVSPLELVSKGLFRDASAYLAKQIGLSIPLQVLRAQVQIHVGTPVLARAAARQLLQENLTNADKSACWEVIGRACLTLGELQEGLRAISKAVGAARAAQDDLIESRVRANNAHSMLQWVGTEAAALEIPRARPLALRAGDAHSLIILHAVVAEIDARKGLVRAASESIESARSLLSRYPNAWLQGRLAIISTGIAFLRSDYSGALKCACEALDCAKGSGSREILIPALGNLALIKLVMGSFDEARTKLREFRDEIEKGGISIAEISVRDTEMQLAIAEGDLAAASRVEASIAAMIASDQRKGSYYEYWHVLTRVRWLFLRGDSDAGLAAALESLPGIERNGDRYLLGLMRLLAAEGYGRVGQLYQGAMLLADAIESNPEGSLEFVAETYRVAGRLTAAEDSSAAKLYFDRAVRILEAIGNRTAKANVAEHAKEVIRGIECDGRTPAAREVVRFAALVESAANGRLLADDTLKLIADADVAQSATIVETSKDGRFNRLSSLGDPELMKRDAETASIIKISTGSYGNCIYSVQVIPKKAVTHRSTLLAVQRLVRSARVLAAVREQDRERRAGSSMLKPENQLGLVCASERMLDLIKTIRRVAASNVNVLLTGETGVGKELFARALHLASARSDRTFLPFNCATVPRDLFDSQLFGHKRGSFTGALSDAPGVIRAAAGGTLFLDEIGEMTIETQPKLLRFLESGEILPIGETKPQFVDVRIVAATNARLDQQVADGRFREDLYYRLNVIRIEIPPLRERREEIPALVEHFLERFANEFQKPMLRVADETLEYLVLHSWPGNVRQLANEVRRMVAMAEPGAVLMPAHLSDDIIATRRTISADTGPRKAVEVVTRIDQPLEAAVEHIERAAIQRALAVCEGRLDEAAKMLGLSRKGLYLKRQRLHLG